jgi:sodium transport system permease protein
MAHVIIQQSLSATALGLVIGYIAVQTGSLIPGMLFHATYNSLMFVGPSLIEKVSPHRAPDAPPYSWPILAVGAGAAAVLIYWLHRLPYQATREEQIGEARARQQHHPIAASASTSAE